jgi:hypothetical protein
MLKYIFVFGTNTTQRIQFYCLISVVALVTAVTGFFGALVGILSLEILQTYTKRGVTP